VVLFKGVENARVGDPSGEAAAPRCNFKGAPRERGTFRRHFCMCRRSSVKVVGLEFLEVSNSRHMHAGPSAFRLVYGSPGFDVSVFRLNLARTLWSPNCFVHRRMRTTGSFHTSNGAARTGGDFEKHKQDDETLGLSVVRLSA
jgi:hypothetical protein